MIAGKTGTTENYGDAWFVGWTKEYTVAVWVGYPDELKPMETEFQGEPVAGGTYPRRDLEDVHAGAAEDRPAAQGRRRRRDAASPTPTPGAGTGTAPGRPRHGGAAGGDGPPPQTGNGGAAPTDPGRPPNRRRSIRHADRPSAPPPRPATDPATGDGGQTTPPDCTRRAAANVPANGSR